MVHRSVPAASSELRTLITAIAIGLILGVTSVAEAQSTVTAVGRELRYRGERIALHGVGMADPLLARQNRPAADYAVLASQWRTNVVRLAIHPGTWKSVDKNYLVGRLREEVSAALANGQFVIITWHVIGWPDAYFENSANDPDFYDSDFQLAKDYWARIAAEFGSDGRVIFELWNEPVHANDADARLPRWFQIKPYYEELIAVVRQFSGNLVLATGNNYAFDLRGIADSPLADSNVAYTWHVYAFGAIDEQSLDIFLAGVGRVAPVLVTEWGFNFSDPAQWPGDARSFGPGFVGNFLRARQLHSAAWAWAPGWSPSMVAADFATPTSYGAFVKRFLTENEDVSARVRGRKQVRTTGGRFTVRGKAAAPLGLERVEFKVGKSKWRNARGTDRWRFAARLATGQNKILVRAIDIGGHRSKPLSLRITRTSR